MTSTLTKPELTMPEAEATLLRDAYTRANVILEYGSGGSTVLAGDMAGKHVTSVESDKSWWRMMMEWFEGNPAHDTSTVEMLYADVGPTKEWGHPKDDRGWKRFADYPLAVWSMDGFKHPDVVLVDGRFRVGCALATAFNITRPVTLLFDDYAKRTNLHTVQEFLGTPTLTGRMAAFDLTPQAFPVDRLLEIMKYMLRP